MVFKITNEPVTRGVLAKKAACHIETVRYYENIGLLLPPSRTEGGHRLYKIDDQRRLRFILRCRELGFNLDELRSLLSIVDTDTFTCGEIKGLSTDHLKSVREKIKDLKRLEKTLSGISKNCMGGEIPECPIIDALWAD